MSDAPLPFQSLLELITASLSGLIVYVDADERYRYGNWAGAEWCGVPFREAIGKSLREVVGDAVYTMLHDDIQRALSGQPGSFERELIWPDGRTRDARCHFAPHFGTTGKVQGVSLFVTDLTQNRRIERLLEDSEQRYNSLFDNHPDAVYSIDLEGNFLSANAACEAVTGYTPAELLEMSFLPLIIPEDIQQARQHFALAAQGQPQSYEIRLRHKQGQHVHLHCTKIPIVTHGKVIGVYGVARDITRQRNTESARELALAQLEAVLNSATDGIIVGDPVGNVILWNPAGLAMHQFETLAEAQQSLSDFRSLFTLADMDGVLIPFDQWPMMRLMRGEVYKDYELYLRRLDTGREWWMSYSGSPARDRDGTILLLVMMVRDITAHRRDEEQMRQFQFIGDNANDAFFLLDADGRFVYVNVAACRSLGYTAEEFRTMRSSDVNPFSDEANYRALFHRAEGERLPLYESQQRRADGSIFPIEASITRLDIGGRALLFASCRDITERKRAEQELATAYRREALLNKIGQVMRQTTEPQQVTQAALDGLAEALGVDRCLIIVPDRAENRIQLTAEYRRSDLPSLLGDYPISDFGLGSTSLFSAGEPIVVSDTELSYWPASMLSMMSRMQIRSMVMVPFLQESEVVGVLGVYMADAPRIWTPDAVVLVEAVASQLRAATETAHARLRAQEARARQRAFLRDVLASVTEGHLLLCQSAEELPPLRAPAGPPILLSMAGGLSELRRATQDACMAAGLSEERAYDLITAASEAGMNTIVHVGEGTGQVFADADAVQVRVQDHGAGIAVEDLPRATLEKGYSSAGTLGHGMKMMLQTADQVFLLTGATGTTVIIEQHRVALPSSLPALAV